jgi:3-deoxy-D-manno-octulosonic-acid transferase
LIYGIYRLLIKLVSALSLPVFLVSMMASGKHRKRMRQRFGYYDDLRPSSAKEPLIWIHGASVGEVMAARILAGMIHKEFPHASLIISTMTEYGLQVANERFGKMATCITAPLDLPGPVKRAIDSIRPDIYICLETELWPSLLTQLRNSDTRLFLLNGRLSNRSCRRYRLLRSFSSKILDVFDSIATISDADARRFISIGARKEKISVTGNVKYDLPEQPVAEKIRTGWQQKLDIENKQPVLVAGSTHPGEEEVIIEAFQALKKTIPGLLLIIAPRHLNRLQEVRETLNGFGAAHALLSQMAGKNRLTDIIIVDTMGELASLYSVASYVFCGGSLVPRGGHNIIEAAIWGVPVFYGPNMKDFADAKHLLEEKGVGFMVRNSSELIGEIQKFAADQRLLQEVSGAAEKMALSQQGTALRQLAPVFDTIRDLGSNNISNH